MTHPVLDLEPSTESWLKIDPTKPLQQEFDSLAAHLLNGHELLVNGVAHEIFEVEFYYHSKDHPDPFAHRKSVQATLGKWYLHKEKGVGTKHNGLDITFGVTGESHGGVLLRTLRKVPDNTFLEGPGNIVEGLRKQLNVATLPDLARELSGNVSDHNRAIHLFWCGTTTYQMVGKSIAKSPRVNLSLENTEDAPNRQRFLMVPYRYTRGGHKYERQPCTIFLALLVQGVTEQVARLALSVRKAESAKWLEAFRRGQKVASLDPYFGRKLGTNDLCELYGAWVSLYG